MTRHPESVGANSKSQLSEGWWCYIPRTLDFLSVHSSVHSRCPPDCECSAGRQAPRVVICALYCYFALRRKRRSLDDTDTLQEDPSAEPSVRIREHNTIGNWEAREATPGRNPSYRCLLRHPLQISTTHLSRILSTAPADGLGFTLHPALNAETVESVSYARPGGIRHTLLRLHHPRVHPAYPPHLRDVRGALF
ncbi:hypothetical protein LY76DRAFT_378485 [Colletotrichum caudatum]|nr:hypothetical protein LY76DRAFT_378485 [Colletotrichum caudatum]